MAIGGDGTVNEIARSLVHTSVAFGVIPCGSGNGLARHLRIPMDPLGSIKVLNRFDIECLDYGKINDVPFFVHAVWGLMLCKFQIRSFGETRSIDLFGEHASGRFEI